MIRCALLALSVLTLLAPLQLDALPSKNQTVRLGREYFRTLPDGRLLYRWPHGLYETFVKDETGYLGGFGSRYDEQKGFVAVLELADYVGDLAERFTAAKDPVALRALAGTVLLLYWSLPTPYYVLSELHERVLAEVPEAPALKQELFDSHPHLARLTHLRTKLSFSFGTNKVPDQTPYYALMFMDGYFDVAISGGTLDNQSGAYMDALRTALRDQLGFTAYPGTENPRWFWKEFSFQGVPLLARVVTTATGSKKLHGQRNLANFAMGLANADLTMFHGHSNYQSGKYKFSEEFEDLYLQLGLNDQKDLERRAPLGGQHYALLVLESCDSFSKYAAPILAEARKKGKTGRTMDAAGTADIAYFADFVPRTTELLEQLLAAADAHTINVEVNKHRPTDTTPNFVFRGFFEDENRFVAPRSVRLGQWEQQREKPHLVTAQDEQGRTYYSTANFVVPPGVELVQIRMMDKTLFGLGSDGRIYYVGKDGAGLRSAMVPPEGRRFVYISNTVKDAYRYALDELGRLYYYRTTDTTSETLVSKRQSPEGVRFVQIGSFDGRSYGKTEDGLYYLWNDQGETFQPVEGDLEVPEEDTHSVLLGAAIVKGRKPDAHQRGIFAVTSEQTRFEAIPMFLPYHGRSLRYLREVESGQPRLDLSVFELPRGESIVESSTLELPGREGHYVFVRTSSGGMYFLDEHQTTRPDPYELPEGGWRFRTSHYALDAQGNLFVLKPEARHEKVEVLDREVGRAVTVVTEEAGQLFLRTVEGTVQSVQSLRGTFVLTTLHNPPAELFEARATVLVRR